MEYNILITPKLENVSNDYNMSIRTIQEDLYNHFVINSEDDVFKFRGFYTTIEDISADIIRIPYEKEDNKVICSTLFSLKKILLYLENIKAYNSLAEFMYFIKSFYNDFRNSNNFDQYINNIYNKSKLLKDNYIVSKDDEIRLKSLECLEYLRVCIDSMPDVSAVKYLSFLEPFGEFCEKFLSRKVRLHY